VRLTSEARAHPHHHRRGARRRGAEVMAGRATGRELRTSAARRSLSLRRSPRRRRPPPRDPPTQQGPPPTSRGTARSPSLPAPGPGPVRSPSRPAPGPGVARSPSWHAPGPGTTADLGRARGCGRRHRLTLPLPSPASAWRASELDGSADASPTSPVAGGRRRNRGGATVARNSMAASAWPPCRSSRRARP
jgi:hypothetical protein